METKKHGGKRLNAGRKSQYNEPTETISFRVPKSLIEPITTIFINKKAPKI